MIRGSVISSIAYFRPFTAEARLLGAAVRHLVGAERGDVVHDDAADLESPGAPRTRG